RPQPVSAAAADAEIDGPGFLGVVAAQQVAGGRVEEVGKITQLATVIARKRPAAAAKLIVCAAAEGDALAVESAVSLVKVIADGAAQKHRLATERHIYVEVQGRRIADVGLVPARQLLPIRCPKDVRIIFD